MGAFLTVSESSKKINDSQYFAVWTLQDVRAALERCRRMTHSAFLGDLHLNRRQFWEVFTDYSVMLPSTKGKLSYLTLPHTVFEHFAVEGVGQTADPTATKVAALHILMALALLSQGQADAQLEFCFSLFDLDNNGMISLTELTMFCTALVHCAQCLHLLEKKATAAQIRAVSETMMEIADTNADNVLSVAEFVEWSKSHVHSQRFLRHFHPESHWKQQKDSRGNPELRHQFGKVVEGMNNCKQLLNLVAEHKGNFDEFDIRRLRARFLSKSNRGTTLTAAQFSAALVAEFPTLKGLAVDNMFSAFDTDGSGQIDFREFIAGLCKLMSSSKESKITMLFEMYDMNGDGNITVEELLPFVRREYEATVRASVFTQEILKSFDINVDGRISRNEFTTLMLRDPILYECFAKSLVNAAAIPLNETLRQWSATVVTLDRLLELWYAKYSSLNSRDTVVTPSEVQAFMKLEFRAPQEAMGVVDRMYASLDDGSSVITWAMIFACMAQCIDATFDEKSTFVFKLFDTDNSGALDYNEMCSLLNATKHGAKALQLRAHDLLKSIDANGDGQISREEFVNAAISRPELMAAFESMFGGTALTGPGGSTANGLAATVEARRLARVKGLLETADRSASTAVSFIKRPDTAQFDPQAAKKELVAKARVNTALGELRRLSGGSRAQLVGNLVQQVASSSQLIDGDFDASIGAITVEDDFEEESKGRPGSRLNLRTPLGSLRTPSGLASPSLMSTGSLSSTSASMSRPAYKCTIASLAAKEHGKALSQTLAEQKAELKSEIRTQENRSKLSRLNARNASKSSLMVIPERLPLIGGTPHTSSGTTLSSDHLVAAATSSSTAPPKPSAIDAQVPNNGTGFSKRPFVLESPITSMISSKPPRPDGNRSGASSTASTPQHSKLHAKAALQTVKAAVHMVSKEGEGDHDELDDANDPIINRDPWTLVNFDDEHLAAGSGARVSRKAASRYGIPLTPQELLGTAARRR